MGFTDRTPTEASGTGPTVSVNKPTGTAANDLILLFVDTESASTAPTTPTGFTLLGSKTSTLQSFRVDVYYRVADGTEGTTFSVTGGTGVGWLQLICHVIAGGATSSPVDASSSNANTTAGTAVSVSGVTTTAVDELLFFATDWNGSDSYSTPTGFTQLLSDGVLGMALYSMVQSSSGATGTISSTLTASDSWIAWLVAVKPASGGTTVSSGVVDVGGGPHGLKSVVADALGSANVGNAGDLDFGIQVGGGGGLSQGFLLGGGPDGLKPVVSDALGSANVGNTGDLDFGMLVGGGGALNFGILLGGGGGLAQGHLLGGGPSGLAVASVAAAGVVDVGSLASPGGDLASVLSDALASLGIIGGGPDGLTGVSYALMGNWSGGTPNPSGITPFTPTIVPPIFALLGGSGGILPSGGVFITAPRVHFGQRDVPGGGISNPFHGSSVSYPGGHWALVVCWMWRQTSPGVFGWVACPVKVWRNPGPNWSTLTT